MIAERPDLLVLLVAAIAVALLLVLRPEFTRPRPGKILAFVGIFLLPVLAVWRGIEEHIELSKSKEFCLSCHVMRPYGRSLYVDDNEYIPAVHFQNHLVPPDKACFTCHTDYTMYGDLKAKMRGLRHVFVYYTGSAPDTIRLYHPYNNRECLHCHAGARKFVSESAHSEDDTTYAAMMSGRLSCLASGCHDTAHEVHSRDKVEFWRPAR